MKPTRCGQCGSKELKSSEIKGKTFPYRDYPAVVLTKSTRLWVCQSCNEVMLSATDAKKLDQLLEASITEQINFFIETIVSRENCKQSGVAVHIGVSPEYLSEIKSGRKIPKFQTFNFLKTLAFNPSSFAVSDPNFNKQVPA